MEIIVSLLNSKWKNLQVEMYNPREEKKLFKNLYVLLFSLFLFILEIANKNMKKVKNIVTVTVIFSSGTIIL